MIVRGLPDDVEINRTGHLSPRQLARLRALTPFRLPALPSLLVGILLAVYGFTRGDTPGWIVLGLGIYLALSAGLRFRQQTRLKAGEVSSLVGVLERIEPSPLAAFESTLLIGGQNYVLLSHGGQTPLQLGERYRCFVVQGITRMGIVVALEAA